LGDTCFCDCLQIGRFELELNFLLDLQSITHLWILQEISVVDPSDQPFELRHHFLQVLDAAAVSEGHTHHLVEAMFQNGAVGEVLVLKEIEKELHDLQELHGRVLLALEGRVVAPFAHTHHALQEELGLERVRELL